MLVADDGSRFVLGYHDTHFDLDCSFREAQDGRTRCLPAASSIAWNVDCTKKVALYKVGATPPRIVTTSIEGCRRHAFAATDLGFVPIAYLMPESACWVTSTSPAVQLGEELPASEFVEETTQIVSDRQLSQTVRVIGRARIPGIIEDREFGDCTFSLDSGEYRCLPGIVTPYFFDASCTQGFACSGAFVCGRPPLRFLLQRGTCSATVRPMGPPIPGPAMSFSSIDGRCIPGSFGSGTCEQVSPAGEVIPRSAFAIAKLVAE